MHDNRPQGEPCELLEWDTEFWDTRIARVRGDTLSPDQMHSIDNYCQDERIACLYFLARADDPHTPLVAEDGGFHLTDVRVMLRQYLDEEVLAPPTLPEGLKIRESRPADVETLRRIAGTSHQQTRFYFDPHFPRERCRALYEAWITRSCEGFADVVLVATLDDMPVGYVSCHLPKGPGGVGEIGLVGVSERARGRAIGGLLVNEALRWFMTTGVTEVSVVTQGRNTAAQRLYQRTGFLINRLQLWYHKWYLPPARSITPS
jgi:dTDP-4-amino-4,6-dideoxy-D-galactose acyltransferase